jgi:hypothetical protein
MANLFNSIRIKPPKYNRFDLSHDVKLTAKFGKLVPILCRPTLPGDVYKLNSEVLVRLAPMIAPIMTKVNVYTHFFFVPNRLLYSEWRDFITGGKDGTFDGVYPRYRIVGKVSEARDKAIFGPGSLADYLGFPVQNGSFSEVTVDALPFLAYQLICDEYYRDENLDNEVFEQSDGGVGTISGNSFPPIFQLRNRAWKKDYFTSALPFAQRGDEVELPLQGSADITSKSADGRAYVSDISVAHLTNPPFPSQGDYNIHLQANSDNNANIITENGQRVEFGTGDGKAYVDLNQLNVDLSSASSATINELRRAIKAQEFLELAARGGSRYIEQIYSYFGVRSSDARLQRPEFLGGGKSPIMISDVLQTSQSTDNSAQANPAGHGVGVQNSHSFKYRCEEHGFIVGILSVMPNAAYMQGMPRLFSKFDRLDYYWPQFAHLGEQEILNQELFYQPGSNPQNSGTFGYTPRYAEYKTMMDSIHGDFRTSLNFWHMGRIFSTLPGLNSSFIHNVEEAANRVFNVVDDDVDKIWINIHHNLKALMKMPKYGTPYM